MKILMLCYVSLSESKNCMYSDAHSLLFYSRLGGGHEDMLRDVISDTDPVYIARSCWSHILCRTID